MAPLSCRPQGRDPARLRRWHAPRGPTRERSSKPSRARGGRAPARGRERDPAEACGRAACAPSSTWWYAGNMRLVLALPALCAAGCAVPKEAGFPDVAAAVEHRIGKRVVWDRGGAEDAEVRKSIAALLAHPLGADEAVQIALLNNK